jgi:hypothetical protein
MRGGPFSMKRDGSIDVRVSVVEIDALRHIMSEMIDALATPDATELQRLFPQPSDDPILAQELTRLMGDDLVTHKVEAARAVVRCIDAGARKRDSWRATLQSDDAETWLHAINDARLVLGTRLGVTEEMDHRPLPPSDARANEHNMYLYLSALEGYLVDVLLSGMPATGTD